MPSTNTAEAETAAPQRVALRAILTVFLPFAGGYYLSYVYRSVNAIIADRLQADVGLSAAELGVLTSAYFVAFAAFQLPLGLLLDRYGPRRVNGVLLVVAAAGSTLFAVGGTLLELWLARALIGLGVAAGLMAALKAITQWFPERRWPLVNGCFLAMGGLGAMSATAPVEAVLRFTDWRGLFLGLALATLAVALAVFLVVPERRHTSAPPSLKTQVLGLKAIYGDPFFWRLAPMSGLAMATSLSIHGLWAGPWLRDVAGLDRTGTASTLLFMAAAMTVGFVLWGTIADLLQRRGVRLTQTLGVGIVGYLLALAAIVGKLAPESIVPWLTFGLISNISSLSYTVLSRHFPIQYAGRANTALNLLVFLFAFGVQAAIGAIVDRWPAEADGGYPDAAYQTAFGCFWGLVLLAFCWFALGARRAPMDGAAAGSSTHG
jgi:MFS family permease